MDKDSQPNIFQDIAEFWTFQLNNEIYLRNYPHIARGSKEYFDIILEARRRFIYYFPAIIKYLKTGLSPNILEVGCGMGTDALMFAREGFKVTGLDITPAHLVLAEKLFNLYYARGTFLEGNAEALPFPDNTFDCVYSFGVLHHTPDTGKAINEIRRVLVPQGRAVIMLYHKWSLNNLVHWILQRGFENAREGPDSPVTHRFSRQEVRKMCGAFTSCRIEIEYLFGAGWGKVYDLIPRSIYFSLSRRIGWHLVLYLEK
ncbi:MAG TPA: class I SAM-dependent methyltransferase [Syntrophales bacterium]|nr:class I SAM-dependent methyltransferase [Syntrophales bacterium]